MQSVKINTLFLNTPILTNWHFQMEKKHLAGKYPAGSSRHDVLHWHAIYALEAGVAFTRKWIQEES